MGLKTLLILDHQTNEAQNDLDRYLQATNRASAGLKLEDAFIMITSGMKNTKVFIGTGAVQASGTVTVLSMVATNTVTINGVVFTCVASGATGNQFNIGGSDTLTAASLAAAINASVTANVTGVVTAVAVGTVVTITAFSPSLAGNLCTLAISAGGSVSGANLTGGTNGATQTTTLYGSSQ